MKTIIKAGDKTTYKATCECCGCVFTYEDEDEIKEESCRPVSNIPFFGFQIFVECPCCKHKIFLRGTK